MLAHYIATQALLDSGQVVDPAKCHPDTRVVILADLQEWAHRLIYDYPIKWISGSAGVGKTAIMRTTAEALKWKKLLLACFFFWRTGERCNTAEFLIATLAYQIAISIPRTRPYIERAVEEHPHIFTQTLRVQSQALIIDPITAVYQDQALPMDYPRIFVVDGLDECLLVSKQLQDAEKQKEVLVTLYWTLQQLPVPFTLLIASRPEYHIQSMFDSSLKDVSSRLMLNDSDDTSDDIRRFYIDKFHEIRTHHPLRSFLPSPEWPSPEIIDILVDNACGQFIYASTVIKFVRAIKKDPSSQLNAIFDADMRGDMRPFQPLDMLYSTILSMIDDEDLTATLRVLGVIQNFDSHPLAFWDAFLGLREGEGQRLLLGLESVVFVSEDACRFYHASLGDFLFDLKRSGPFFIDKRVVNEDMAKRGIFHVWRECSYDWEYDWECRWDYYWKYHRE